MTGVVLPAAIPATLPQEELRLLAFIYENGYTLKTDGALGRMAGMSGIKVAELLNKWERKGWVTVRKFRGSGGRVTRWIIAAM